MSTWQIESSFLTDGYDLITPDGTKVGTYDTLAAARAAMNDLLRESLNHTEPFDAGPRTECADRKSCGAPDGRTTR